ncbi:MAG: adenosine deaminase [bacterium]|nr:adenosine deaminase [bacterium]
MVINKNKRLSRSEIEALPKVELHVHLDCCLSYDLVAELGPGMTREVYEHKFIAPAKCKDLADFLKVIGSSLELMQTEKELQLVTGDFFKQLKQDNVIYAEVRFAPLLHLEEGLNPQKVVEIVEAAVSKEVETTGIEARVILCTLRHFTEEQAMTTAKLVEQFKGTRVAALDLAADEAGFPIGPQVPAFQYVREHGIPCTAHAGEAKGPESVRETLKLLKTSRVGHGVRSVHDPELVNQLKDERIHLEVCPSCNVQINVFDTYADHPIDRLYNAGVSVGINTDTRTITNVSLSDEYERLQDVFGWGREHFSTCNRNALAAAFLHNEIKEQLEKKLVT